jgi:hypothetical protein
MTIVTGDVCTFLQLGFSSIGVATDKECSSILIYSSKDTEIYTEMMALIKNEKCSLN